MQIIIDFLTGIGNFISAIFEYLFTIVRDTAYVLGLLGYFAAELPRIFMWIPGEYFVLISLVFTIAIICRIRSGD